MSNKKRTRRLVAVGSPTTGEKAPPHPAGTTEWNRYHVVCVEAPKTPNRMGTILGVWRTENGDDALRLAERLWEWAGDRNRDEVVMVTDQLARQVVWQKTTAVQLEVDVTITEETPPPAKGAIDVPLLGDVPHCADPACPCHGVIGLDEGLAAARAVERGEAPSGSVILKVTGPSSLADPAAPVHGDGPR